MANRSYSRTQALSKEIKFLYAKATIGASGAVTMSAADSIGIASIAKSADGRYTVTLQDKYMKLAAFDVAILSASPQDLVPQLVSESVASAKTIVFRTNAVGVETNPSSGTVLFIRIDVKNSSV